MKGLLLDTHIVLKSSGSGLSDLVLARLQAEANLYVSVASLWEIAIKVGLGKLRLDMTLDELISSFLSRSGIKVLDLSC